MFLEDINNYSLKMVELKNRFIKPCNKCNNTRIIRQNSGLYSECECSKKAKLQARMVCNGLPESLLNLNFNKLKCDNDIIKLFKDYSINIENNIFNNNNLLVINDNKIITLECLAALSNNLIFKKKNNGKFYNIVYITLDELLKAEYNSRNNFELKKTLDMVLTSKNCSDLLIINCLGDELDNKHEQTAKYLENLFIKRIMLNKLIIISTEYSLAELASIYGSGFTKSLNSFTKYDLNNFNNSNSFNDLDNDGYY